jgi:hypothetical protein
MTKKAQKQNGANSKVHSSAKTVMDEIFGAARPAKTVSEPGAVLEVRAVSIPPQIQAKMAAEIRRASGKSGQ